MISCVLIVLLVLDARFHTVYAKDLCGVPAIKPQFSENDPIVKLSDSELFRINAGDDAHPHSWPWQVSLLRRSGKNWVHCCGGTLVSRRIVLTAAHCTVYSLDANDYKVILGVHDKSRSEPSGVLMDVFNISLAPGNDWNNQVWAYDFAVVTLSEMVRYTDEISPACMALETNYEDGTFCYVTGWGISGDPFDKITRHTLMQAGLFIQHNCFSSNSSFNFASDRMICAGNKNKDTCSGDSGGPLVCFSNDRRWYLFGITSRGTTSGCGRNQPGIYSKVSFYKNLIYEHLNATSFLFE